MTLADLIVVAGLTQLGLLGAVIQVPSRLRWRTELEALPRLHRQMHWVYGGYVALAMVAFGGLSIFTARELSSGSALARGLCAYMALFWAIPTACSKGSRLILSTSVKWNGMRGRIQPSAPGWDML